MSLPQWRMAAQYQQKWGGVAAGHGCARGLIRRIGVSAEAVQVGALEVLLATLYAARPQRKYVLAEVRMRSCQR